MGRYGKDMRDCCDTLARPDVPHHDGCPERSPPMTDKAVEALARFVAVGNPVKFIYCGPERWEWPVTVLSLDDLLKATPNMSVMSQQEFVARFAPVSAAKESPTE